MTLAPVCIFGVILMWTFSRTRHLFPYRYDFFFSPSEAYSTLDQRERRHTLDEATDTLPVLVALCLLKMLSLTQLTLSLYHWIFQMTLWLLF